MKRARTLSDEQLLRALRSVGFACFVRHLAIFDRPGDLVATASALQGKTGWAAAGCLIRVSNARRVIEAGRRADALDLIAASDRMPVEVRAAARAAR